MNETSVAGMTLIEAIIYIALLSILLAGAISSAYATHLYDLRTADAVYEAYEHGTEQK